MGNTEVVATKEAMIAAVVQKELIEGAVVAPRCYDVTQYCEPGAKSIEFPKAGHMTVINRTEGSAGDASVVTYATDKMDLSFNAYLAWIVDYKSKVQSKVNVQVDLAARAARAHSKYLDTQIIAELETAGDATATAGAVTYAIAVEMMATFMNRVGDSSQGSWLFGPTSWSALINIDEFKRADIYGSSAIPSGTVGTIFGVPVVISQKVSGNAYYLFDKSAIAYGLQAGPSYSEQGANEYGSQAKRAVLDQIFGVKALLINQEGAGAAESALIIKDAN